MRNKAIAGALIVTGFLTTIGCNRPEEPKYSLAPLRIKVDKAAPTTQATITLDPSNNNCTQTVPDAHGTPVVTPFIPLSVQNGDSVQWSGAFISTFTAGAIEIVFASVAPVASSLLVPGALGTPFRDGNGIPAFFLAGPTIPAQAPAESAAGYAFRYAYVGIIDTNRAIHACSNLNQTSAPGIVGDGLHVQQ